MTDVQRAVHALLERAPAFNQLPPDRRRALARDMVHVASRLADPAGLTTAEFRSPLLAKPARERIPSFEALVDAVDFPAFVANLIHGTFNAIVNASIEQMEAYGKLVKQVAEAVDAFTQENVDDAAASDWLASSFPEVFCRQDGRLKARPNVPPRAWSWLEGALRMRGRARSADVKTIVQAARRRLARARQQQLATMIMMGINRTVGRDAPITPRGQRAVRPGRTKARSTSLA
jgi:hypothetical protein